MGRRSACALGVGLLTGVLGAGTCEAFEQDVFAIGFWVDPPASEDWDFRYQEIADANFTLVLGGFGARTPEQAVRQLELCERLGMKAIVWAGEESPPEDLPDGPACWGYAVRDEPNAERFAALRARVDAIQAARPDRVAYINLFPNYASPAQLGTETYDEHVRRFVDEVRPGVLCMDHYPLMRPDADNRDGYLANLEVLREHSLRAGIPFWNFFNTMPFGPHTDPTEAQLRWQINASIAYGAKGVLYFCYWTPPGDEFPKGGAILTEDGRRTRHYEQAKRVNAVVKALGLTLMQLTSTRVVRVHPEDDAAAPLAGGPIRSLATSPVPGEYLVGEFTHADGRRAALLMNHSITHTAWATVEFDADPASVLEVDPATGEEAPVRDESPAMEGLQISLDSAEARLFLLP